MIHLCDVGKSFGERPLFEGVNLRIARDDRVGLVGKNGSGKTTLFRVIAGELSADTGEVGRAKGAKIGYLRQEISQDRQGPVLFNVLDGVEGFHSTRHLIEELTHDPLLKDAELGRPVLARLTDLQTRYEMMGGDALVPRAKEILSGLGFDARLQNDDWAKLSGGWKMRAELARMLLSSPEALLLDEPTNHLDMESMMWFENYLQSFTGALVLVAHDREFLNRTVKRIIEVDQGKVRQYPGDYDNYKRLKAEDERLAVKRFQDQQAQIRELEDFISRNRVRKDRARQAQSRMKKLDAIERVEAPREEGHITFEFPEAPRPGKLVVKIRGLAKSYGTKEVFRNLSLDIYQNEKCALVGVNGAGKSTLMKILSQRLEASGGELELGYNVVPAYFAQHHLEELNSANTVWNEMLGVSVGLQVSKIRNLLGAFKFTGTDIDKKVGYLSGGEKSRLALAKLLVRPSNLLMMDEPTNHLDIESREILEEALRQYQGAILFTSHDRRFIDAVAGRVLEMENGVLESYPGNFSYYAWKKKQGEKAQVTPAATPTPKEPEAQAGRPEQGQTEASRKADRDRKRQEAEYRQALHRDTADLKKKLTVVEQSISTAEVELEQLETAMDSPEQHDAEGILLLSHRHGELNCLLEDLMQQWETLEKEIQTRKAVLDKRYGMLAQDQVE
jgi:ATP-binding cassette subfamily F protein 3